MARLITTDMAAALESGQISVILLYRAHFPSGVVRSWSGIGPLTWNRQEWQGAGDLLQISGLEEKAGAQPSGMTVSLSGVPSNMLSIALSEHYQGSEFHCWLGALNEEGYVIPSPIPIFKGLMDVMNIDEGPETSTISVTVENHLIDLKRAREKRWTNAAQKNDYPHDHGFEFVESLQDKEILWGRT